MFDKIVSTANNIIWSVPFVCLCLAAGLFFTIYLKFPQIRHFGKMFKFTFGKSENSEDGISSFQAFASTVGSRVGMGNIAGVATAIYFGGPGAVVWMWIIAFLGGASSFAETALAQAYKTRLDNGDYVGGGAYFIEKGLKCKPLAVLFAIATIIGPGLTMPGVQTQQTASVLGGSFGIPTVPTAIVLAILIFFVIAGSVKRIGKIAELLAPVMTIVYILLGLIVIFLRIGDVPGVLALMFKSAFGAEQAFAGIVGSMIMWGVKRGVYSSEAGQGSGAIVAAAAETSHPAKQGLIQTLSVFIDTIVVCTISALIILLSGFYNVTDGTNLLVSGAGDTEYGILYAQNGLNGVLGGTWAGSIMAICAVLFVFTSLMGYYYQAESNVNYLSKNNKTALWIFRVVFSLSVFAGAVIQNDTLWSMGDLGCGLMAWFNVIAILLMCKQVKTIMNDFDEQYKLRQDAFFDPEILGIKDELKIWTKYTQKKHEK